MHVKIWYHRTPFAVSYSSVEKLHSSIVKQTTRLIRSRVNERAVTFRENKLYPEVSSVHRERREERIENSEDEDILSLLTLVGDHRNNRHRYRDR
jgi:hypothetical protein